ncbi:hypothetical protein DFP72DRAFT_866414 [Ephemerocybe angulata]|uniref:Uncharacterized protein n=1 Tax=Ephemerocybe angulata TaxID=980116 RepID=A0A8H6ILD8_9AGAR|nr:hypothetical protein DFP72DRAFT_866414 [Tulosesus angulatus]
MYTTRTTALFARANNQDEDAPGLSKHNVIIVAVCCSFGGLAIAYVLWRTIRNCQRSSQSTPHPLPQPLAHQRQQEIAQVEQETPRLPAWYTPQFAEIQHLRPYSVRDSEASLLGGDGLTQSPQPSLDNSREPSDSSHQHLPLPLSLPNAAYHSNRPASRSSFISSDASCAASPARELPISPDSATPFLPRQSGQSSPMTPPFRRARPLSMSSTHTRGSIGSRTTRYGVPHAPHNQIQIILPTPLASTNNSMESVAIPRSRLGSEAVERRSVADPWINRGIVIHGILPRPGPDTPGKARTLEKRRVSQYGGPVAGRYNIRDYDVRG